MNDQEKFARALQSALDADIAEYEKLPDVKISYRFERRMKKLFRAQHPEMRLSGVRLPLRRSVKYAVLAALLAVVLTGATFAVYRLWETYKVKDHSLYSMLYITDIENAPKTLEEKYRLGADMSGYKMRIVQDDMFCFLVEYKLENYDTTIIFSQSTKEFSEQVFINTEDAAVMPTEITINEHKGLYYMTNYGAHYVMWDNGDYIIDISAKGIGKNQLILLAETVQKVE